MLYFYPKDFTPGRTTETKRFCDSVPELDKLGACVLGISKDGEKKHAKFADTDRLDDTRLAGDKSKVGATYDSLDILCGMQQFAGCHSFIIDPQGRIAAIYLNVSPARNPQEIVAKLQQLMHSVD